MSPEDLARMNRVLRHRLRNFASGIKSSATFLARELDGRLTPAELEYFPLLQAECDALTEVTARMNLLFDEVPPGGCLPVSAALDDLLGRLRRRFPTAAVDVAAAAETRARAVRDAQYVWLPLEELAVNAIEAAPGQPVRLAVASGPAGLAATVTDVGPGVPAEMPLANLLLPFFTTRPRHLGLGLAIAARLAARLGGRVELERPVGGGLMARLIYPPAALAEP